MFGLIALFEKIIKFRYFKIYLNLFNQKFILKVRSTNLASLDYELAKQRLSAKRYVKEYFKDKAMK